MNTVVRPPQEGSDPPPPRRPTRASWALIALGIACIVWGAFHVLNAIGGYEQRDFAHRKTDREVRRVVHATLPGALARGLVGVALVVAGERLRTRQRREE